VNEKRPALLTLGPGTGKSNAFLTINAVPVSATAEPTPPTVVVEGGSVELNLDELKWHMTASGFGGLIGGLMGEAVGASWAGGVGGVVVGYLWSRWRWRDTQGS
jgi:hypothetical protein